MMMRCFVFCSRGWLLLELCVVLMLVGFVFPVFMSFYLFFQSTLIRAFETLLHRAEWLYFESVFQDDGVSAIRFYPPFQFDLGNRVVGYQVIKGSFYRVYYPGRKLRLTRFLDIESFEFSLSENGFICRDRVLGDLYMPLFLPGLVDD